MIRLSFLIKYSEYQWKQKQKKCHVHANGNVNEMDLIYDWRLFGLMAVSLVMVVCKKAHICQKEWVHDLLDR